MKLDMEQRLVLYSIMPVKGKFADLKIIRSVLDKLEPNDNEKLLWKVQDTVDRGTIWDTSMDTNTDLSFTEKEKEVIKKALLFAEQREALPIQMMEIYEEFNKPEEKI